MTRITHRSAALVAAAAAMLPLGAGTAAATVASDRVATMGSQTTVDAVGYADQLVRAWGRGDRVTTEVYATSSVARALFGYSTPGGVNWRRTGSQGAAGTIYVTYHDDARRGHVTVGVSNVVLGQGGRHAAYTLRFSQAHPIGSVEYADRLVRAWGRGDRGAASRYATPAVLHTLFARSDPGGAHWRRTAAEGAAGTTFVTYHDDARGGTWSSEWATPPSRTAGCTRSTRHVSPGRRRPAPALPAPGAAGPWRCRPLALPAPGAAGS